MRTHVAQRHCEEQLVRRSSKAEALAMTVAMLSACRLLEKLNRELAMVRQARSRSRVRPASAFDPAISDQRAPTWRRFGSANTPTSRAVPTGRTGHRRRWSYGTVRLPARAPGIPF